MAAKTDLVKTALALIAHVILVIAKN